MSGKDKKWNTACDYSPAMKTCDCCGNSYDKCFEISTGGESFAFDCFECAIHRLAPVCPSCHCRIIGHGVEGGGGLFCCAHCARLEGVDGIVDNLDHNPSEGHP